MNFRPSSPAAISRAVKIPKYKNWIIKEAVLKSYFFDEAYRYTVCVKPYISFLGPYTDSAFYTPDSVVPFLKAELIDGVLYFHTLQEACRWIEMEATSFVPKV